MTSTEAPAKANKPLQARAQKTRQAILDATYTCLVEGGVANTTTTAVAKRAGVSQGALFKHFESKHALLVAATEQIFTAMVQDSQEVMKERTAGQGRPRLAVGVDVLFDLAHTPRMQVCLALYATARTDPALAAALKPAFAAQQRNVRQGIRRALAPDLSDATLLMPAFTDFLDALLIIMHGIAAQSPMDANQEGTKRFVHLMVAQALVAFEVST